MKKIVADGAWFKDQQGRTVHLRGVNLSGSSKVPYTPDGASHIRENFYDSRYDVSFVGRPFPLEEADEHFSRLKAWGLTFLRFIVTWEAIEHAGPGKYDTDYLDYIAELIARAGDYGFTVYMDPHQDVWSRFSGGDGAPAWTLEKVGFDLKRFEDTGAAIVHQLHGDPFPRMIWPSNYNKLAAATMFTLFYAGNDFAPNTLIDGEPVQEFLQRHYVAAFQQLAKRLADMPHVIGWCVMNEPSRGYIGHRDLSQVETMLLIGTVPSPFQSMLLGMGHAQSIGNYGISLAGPARKGTHVINPLGRKVWREGCDGVWRQNGVWDYDDNGIPRLLKPDYFYRANGYVVDFAHHYLRPFTNRFAEAIRKHDDDAMIFFEIEAIDGGLPPYWMDDDAERIGYAPHWYDGVTLYTKQYFPWIAYDAFHHRPILGKAAVSKWQAAQINEFRQHAREYLGDVPVIVGETGIPYDLNEKEAFETGDFSAQIHAADDYLRAMERNLVNFTIWNYSAHNSNERGDLWNGEDLSIFSRDQQHDPDDINSGGRALESVVRPYALATAGEPLRMTFDINTGIFEFTFRHDTTVDAPTEFFIPKLQYPYGYIVEVSDGTFEKDEDNQRLIYRHSEKEIPHFIRVLPLVPRSQPDRSSETLVRILIAVMVFLFVRALLRRSRKEKA